MDKKSNFMANLMKAKATMDAVESGNYKVDHAQLHSLNQNNGELLESLPDGAIPNRNINRPINDNLNPSKIDNSRLPDAVKKLMKEQPIPRMEMGGGPTFNIDDVKSMIKKNPVAPERQYQPQNQQVNETVITNSKGQMLITMTEAELDKKINDALLKFMTEHFAKNLKEETIKKTITTLIKEGKLRVKTKTK